MILVYRTSSADTVYTPM